MLRTVGTLVVCILYGALGTAMVRFLYVAYALIAEGRSRDELGITELLLDDVQIREFAILGAAGGLGFGILVLLARGLVWGIRRARDPKVTPAEERDTNAILQADRERRAETYLANRTS